MTLNTAWDCGTPRSTHTAFTWHDPSRNTPKERNKPGPKRTKSERAAMAFETDEERSIRVKAANLARKTEMLRFKGDVHNFAPAKTPSKLIHRATGAMRTV